MPILSLRLENATLLFNGGEERRHLQGSDFERMQGWVQCYEAALKTDRFDTLLGLGRESFQWLDQKTGWLTHALEQDTGPLELELAVPQIPDENERLFLQVPWELLAQPQGDFLARDDLRPFIPWRRLGREEQRLQPAHRDLHLVFMAAAPRGASELDFEAEEAGIIEKTRTLPLTLTVEESGSPDFLTEVVRGLPVLPEVVHLSCHGDIKDKKPVLLLEDEAGDKLYTSGGTLAAKLGDSMPALLFLSACRTAEGRAAASPLAMEMVYAGCANVVGWDGSVNDFDALLFAGYFYQELAGYATVGWAMATARRELLKQWQANPNIASHWHLARLFLGPKGGEKLCASNKSKRSLPNDPGAQEFLDKERALVPVASRTTFVGRRRLLQTILASWRCGESKGAQIHGIGRTGKSSLAARLANRLPHYQTVVVFRDYDALAVLDALLGKLPARVGRELREVWRDQVKKDEKILGDALRDILAGPCCQFDSTTGDKPLLLILDDLERIQEPMDGSRAATPFKSAHQRVMRVILEAFRDVETESRVLLTSRHACTLTSNRGDELIDLLLTVPLPPLSPMERWKQWEAETRYHIAAAEPEGARELLPRILEAARGNPGLQNLLTKPLLRGEVDIAKKALGQVEVFLARGIIPPAGEDAGDFFRTLALQSYREALTKEQERACQALILFNIPMPLSATDAVLAAVGVVLPEDTRARLVGLGLFNQLSEVLGREKHFFLEALLRPLMTGERNDIRLPDIARVALNPWLVAWRRAVGTLPWHPLVLELFRLAQLAEDATAMAEAAIAAGFWLFMKEHDAHKALEELVQPTLSALERAGIAPPLDLINLGAQCAERLGVNDTRRALLELGLTLSQEESIPLAMLWGEYAKLLIQQGELVQAEQWLWKAEKVFQTQGAIRSRAVTLGRIADIYQSRGELDEALLIRLEEELPVYERLGDIRERAITLGKIADIYQVRGELDDALQIWREEVIPVYERLGDIRSRAVTLGQIADIYLSRGDLDEALRIRLEEELPVYERLGDIRERAITMSKISDIYQSRGDLDEALRIRREEEIPVYERLGDIRERAITMSKIADIYQVRGDLEEALRIRREECLPVFEQLGDIHSRAVTLGRIADIYEARGDLDEALRIRREETLPVYERLGDIREYAIAQFKIADIYKRSGNLDEALRIWREESLPVFKKLGFRRECVLTMMQIAAIHAARGEDDEAHKILHEAHSLLMTIP
ncbi:MAG: CHAT domain-containing protein [Magnetococcales bacterium]|nr:CHAT domain-containing protein [Magnetococcales bacterium]